MSAISRPLIPYAVAERIKADVCKLRILFYSGEAPLDVSGQTFELRVSYAGISVLTKLNPSITRTNVNELEILLTDADKASLTRKRYSFTLVNTSLNRTELNGVLAFVGVEPSASYSAQVAPDILIRYFTDATAIEEVVPAIQGTLGWTPVLATVADGLRLVQQVRDWTGGFTGKPATGKYVGALGLVDSLAEATDIRGAVGLNWRGAWAPLTNYAAGDGVSSGGNTYRRKTSGTSGAAFDLTFWDVVAQGGAPADLTVTTEKLVEKAVTPNKTSFLTYSKNGFDSSGVVDASFVSTGTGSISSGSGFARSGRVPVLPNTQYTLSGLIALTSAQFGMRFESASSALLDYYSAGKNGAFNFPLTFVTPANCTFIVFTIRHSSSVLTLAQASASIQLEAGAVATAYEGYGVKLTGARIDPGSLNQDASNQLVSTAEKTAWNGKLDGALRVLGKNGFDSSGVVDGSYVSTGAGAITATAGFARSGRVPVLPNTQYTLSGLIAVTSAQFGMRFESASSALLDYYSAGKNGAFSFPLTFTTPANCVFIVFTIRHSSSVLTLAQASASIQLEAGAVASAYEGYGYKLLNTRIDPSSLNQDTNNQLVSAAEKTAWNGKLSGSAVAYELVTSKNLANPATFTDGAYLETTGAVTTNAGYGYTDFIPVTEGLTYTGWDGTNGMRKTTFYNSSKGVVTGGSSNAITTFTVPAGVAFVRVSYYIAKKGTFQFEQAGAASSFQAYFSPQKTLTSVDGALIPTFTKTNKVTLADCERILICGDSYSAGSYQLNGKGYIYLLSMFTDWNVENYSKSGDRFDMILSRIKSNDATFHPSLGIRAFKGGGYAVLISYRNEFSGTITNTDQLNVYLANLEKVAEAVKNLGFRPIVSSEYFINSGSLGYLVQTALSEYCTRKGYVFADVAQRARILKGNEYPPFWLGSHPGVRTNALFWGPMLKYIQALPRPKAAIKLFRKRSSVSAASSTDLYFKNRTELNKLFKEININQYGLAPSVEKYYDDLTTLNGLGAVPSAKVYEYMSLINKESISFADYALARCVVNARAGNISSFRLILSDPSVTVFVQDATNLQWVQLTSSTVSGVVGFGLNDPQTQVNYDVVTFLLYKAGGFALTDIYYEWAGVEGKDLTQIALPVDLATPELLTTTNISSPLSGWTATGSLTPTTPIDNSLPIGADKVVTLSSNNYLSQVVNFSTETERTRKVQIKLTARNNPPIYASSGNYPEGSSITADTYDLTTLVCELELNSLNVLTFSRQVGLHWTEVFIEVQLPPNTPSLTLRIKAESPTEFCKASVKVE